MEEFQGLLLYDSKFQSFEQVSIRYRKMRKFIVLYLFLIAKSFFQVVISLSVVN